ncbi:MAG: tRNA (adenosine(37)-N6)-threonylcarbamoyltransferase complex transferase subunit TsaD [Patescibacteria group bacterium]
MSRELYLAIETSCDETSLAILSKEPNSDDSTFYNYINSFSVPASIISSQVEVHKEYGGVIPEIGARMHAEQIHFLFKSLLSQMTEKTTVQNNFSNQEKQILADIDTIFVTSEPGLISALRVGLEFAKTMKFYIESLFTTKTVTIHKTNHLKGHTSSCFFEPNKRRSISDSEIFPHLHLLVSGGNSQIILSKSWNNWEIIGQTLDDAAGECLDKIGRMLGLPYPGGIQIAKIAQLKHSNYYNLPVGMRKNTSLDYSFSGLKTAVRYFLQSRNINGYNFEKKLDEVEIKKIKTGSNLDEKSELIYKTCVSAQFVLVNQLVDKFKLAARQHKPKSIGLSGGVSANLLLRNYFEKIKNENEFDYSFYPDISLTGDNAVMIGLAGLVSAKYVA